MVLETPEIGCLIDTIERLSECVTSRSIARKEELAKKHLLGVRDRINGQFDRNATIKGFRPQS